jgi:hypothetical protein
LLSDLEGLLEPKGDPMSLLKWTYKSVAHLRTSFASDGPYDRRYSVARSAALARLLATSE